MTANTRITTSVLAAGILTATASFAADLPIEDRPMDPRIHPVAPEDGAVAVTNPPSIVFWHTSAAAKYTVEICRRADFKGAIVVRGIDLPFYNHTKTLERGKWYWRYYFETRDRRRSKHSPVRRFEITDRSIPFSVPPVDEILKRLPGHPRVYTTKATLGAFRARKDGPAARAFAVLLRRAEGAVKFVPKPPKLGSVTAAHRKKRGLAFWLENGQSRLCANVRPSTLENAAKITRDLAMLYLITGERKYANEAKKRLLWQANFRVDWHQPEKAHHDTVHCYEYGLQRMASAYDCIHDMLSPAERKQALDAIEYHGDACYRKLRFKVRIHLKYQTSHAQQDMHELVTTALAVANDLPAAKTWLEYLIPQYVNRLAWGKNDGGYSEGHYYNYKWHGMLRCAVSLRNAAGIDLFKKPRLTNAGRFWLYCMSLNYWWDHYGDNFSLHTPMSGSSNDLDGANFLASFYQDRYVKWWANQIDAPLQMPLWYLSDATLKEKPPVDVPQAAVYRDVGWAAMYDRFYDSRSTRLFFKCSPWGSHSHAHEDQNSFVIHAFGEILAVDKGYYGYYGDKYHKLICRASKSHNTILVDGKGQGRGIQYNGRVIDFFNGDMGSFVSGDATGAYGGRVDKFIRAVAFIRPNYFVVYDQLEAPKPSTFSWQLNSFLKMRLNEPDQTVTIHSPGAELKATHLLPGNLRYRQSNVREHPLKSRYNEAFPEQWTCWCETGEKARDVRFLTLLEAYRADDGPSLRKIQKVESDGLVGLAFDVGDDNFTVLFQHDVTAPRPGVCRDIETDAKCVIVRKSRAAPGDLRHFHVAGRALKIGGETRFTSAEPASFDNTPRTRHSLPATKAYPITIEDSRGTYDVNLEWVVDEWGRVFYFGRLDPREQGRYDIQVSSPTADILVEDKWDPAHNARGRNVELREGSMLIIKSAEFLNTGAIRAQLKESYKGRIVSLLRNGNFETGVPGYVPIGWWLRHYSTPDPSYAYWSTENPAEGKACLKLVRVKSKIRSYSQSVKIAKPGRYVFRFKAKATCKGASVNTSWSRQSISIRVDRSDEWKEYRAEREMTPHDACIHVLFDKAEGPNQTLWVDDMELGRVAE